MIVEINVKLSKIRFGKLLLDLANFNKYKLPTDSARIGFVLWLMHHMLFSRDYKGHTCIELLTEKMGKTPEEFWNELLLRYKKEFLR